MKGYEEAFKVDSLINKLAEEQPPTKENAREWLAFTRTVISTLHILRATAQETLGLRGDEKP